MVTWVAGALRVYLSEVTSGNIGTTHHRDFSKVKKVFSYCAGSDRTWPELDLARLWQSSISLAQALC